MFSEFENFMRRNGIRSVKRLHIIRRPMVRLKGTFKRMFKTAEGYQVEEKLASILFQYRKTPHTVSWKSPIKLLMRRKLRTRLDVMRPNSGHDRKPAGIQYIAKFETVPVGRRFVGR